MQDHLIPCGCHLAGSPVQSNTAGRFVWGGDTKGSQHAGSHTAWIHAPGHSGGWRTKTTNPNRRLGGVADSSSPQGSNAARWKGNYAVTAAFSTHSVTVESISPQRWGQGLRVMNGFSDTGSKGAALSDAGRFGRASPCVPFSRCHDLAQTWGGSGKHRLQALI